MKPKISVCTITYGQEKFIEKCLKGVLSQEGDFDLEYIIGNDNSPDNTTSIIEKYQKEHPKGHCIKFINRTENIGIMPNFIQTINSSTGDYIAICDGDDYWTDKQKLQKQLNVLENEEKFILTGHNVEIFENEIIHDVSFPYKNPIPIDQNLIYRKNYIPALSLFYRNIHPIPDWMYQCSIGDYPLILFLSQFGEIHFSFEVMARYRLNSGYHSSISKKKRLMLQEKSIEIALKNLELEPSAFESLNYHLNMLKLQLEEGKWARMKKALVAKNINLTSKIKLITQI